MLMTSRVVVRSGRKVPGFSEKGLTFLGIRAKLSGTQPPGHFDNAKVRLSKRALSDFSGQETFYYSKN